MSVDLNESASDRDLLLDDTSKAESPVATHPDDEDKQEQAPVHADSSVSSTSSASQSPGRAQTTRPMPGLQVAAEWYKQYEMLSHRTALFAGLQGMRPQASPLHTQSPSVLQQSSSQSTPSSSSAPSSNDSSLLYSHHQASFPKPAEHDKQQILMASHQALLAQYAQQFYAGQNAPSGLLPMLAHHTPKLFSPDQHEQQHNNSQLNLYPHLSATSSPFPGAPGPFQFYGRHPTGQAPIAGHFGQSMGQHPIRSGLPTRGITSADSRSPSPASSHPNYPLSCDEDDEENEDADSQSINAANGEWTYEEQFKQVCRTVLYLFLYFKGHTGDECLKNLIFGIKTDDPQMVSEPIWSNFLPF